MNHIMKKILLIALVGVLSCASLYAQEKKTFVSIESGTTLNLSKSTMNGSNNFDNKIVPGFYLRFFFNQSVNDKLTLREGVGYNIARTYQENFNSSYGSSNLNAFNYVGVSASSVHSLNIPVQLLWSANSLFQFYGGVSFDALLSDVNSSFAGRDPNYTQDDLKNLRNYAFSIELGTKVKVMKNGYVTLGYRMTPKPFEIAFPNHISETGKHQINIGLVYDFK